VAATKDHVLWDRRPVGLAHLSDGVKADETGPKERFDVGLVLVRKNSAPFCGNSLVSSCPIGFPCPKYWMERKPGEKGVLDSRNLLTFLVLLLIRTTM